MLTPDPFECDDDDMLLERYFDQEEKTDPEEPPPVGRPPMLREPSMYWPNANANLDEALLTASNLAFVRFFSAVETARLRQKEVVPLDDPTVYQVGRFEFHWTVFVYGLRVKGRRNRSYWNKRGLLVPFEQIRRIFAKQGIYVVMTYESSPVVRVFDRRDIQDNPDFSIEVINGRSMYVYKKTDGRNFYNVVPF